MVFPLQLTRWWYRNVLGRPFLVIDACAQYLTTPWTPALMRKAVGPDVKIVVCVREPVAQNVSWWRFEHGAMAWVDSMGIPASAGTDSTRIEYPPRSLLESHRLSTSSKVEKMYTDAEALAGEVLAGSKQVLPDWAITWPNGQLSAAARNGRFADNIQRWHKHFDPKQFEYVEVTELSNDLGGVLGRLQKLLPADYSGQFPEGQPERKLRMNPSSKLSDALEPTEDDLGVLAKYYREHNARLFKLIGRTFDWDR